MNRLETYFEQNHFELGPFRLISYNKIVITYGGSELYCKLGFSFHYKGLYRYLSTKL